MLHLPLTALGLIHGAAVIMLLLMMRVAQDFLLASLTLRLPIFKLVVLHVLVLRRAVIWVLCKGLLLLARKIPRPPALNALAIPATKKKTVILAYYLNRPILVKK